MKKDISTFIPFEHSNFEYKKNIIDLARNEDKSTPQGTLSSTLIYINAVDYVSSHLLENLSYITYLSTHKCLFGIVFRNPNKKNNLPLGEMILELKKYEFPDKNSLIEDLEHFKSTRNKVAHNLLALSEIELNQIDQEINELHITAERIIGTYDTIANALRNVWAMYLSSIQPQVPDEQQQLPLDQNVKSK